MVIIHLIHGLNDRVVSKKVPELILKKIAGKFLRIIYLKNSDHSLSNSFDLQVINDSIDSIRKNKIKQI